MRTRARSLEGQRAYDLEAFYVVNNYGHRSNDLGSLFGNKTLDKGMNGEDFKQFLEKS